MKTNPQNLKYKKYHKPAINSNKNNVPFKITFGNFALKSSICKALTFSQVESGRKAIRRMVKKTGFLWVKIFPYSPLTKKPLSVRMGKGKGPVNSWVCVTNVGQVIYELKSISSGLAKYAFMSAAKKLPFKGIISKQIY